MDICSSALMYQLGIDPTSLFPSRAHILATPRDAKINIIGGIVRDISDPFNHVVMPCVASTVHFFHVADNISSTYLSQATLKALGAMEPSIPQLGTPHSTLAVT